MKKILLIAAAMLLGSSGAWALGTTAGTWIDNNATLTYTAGASSTSYEVNASTNSRGSADSFRVDRKVDMVLTNDDGQSIVVDPSDQDRVTTWTLKNEGNMDQNFSLSLGELPAGTNVYDSDTKDTAGCEIFVGGSTTAFDTSNDMVYLDIDENVTIEVKCDISAKPTVDNGDVMNIELNATAVGTSVSDVLTATSGSDSKDDVDIVLADSVDYRDYGDHNTTNNDPHDGVYVARGGYIVETPVLTVSKTSCVLGDPVNTGDIDNPNSDAKRIPGATIHYLLTIKNEGDANASGITLKDTLAEEFTDDGAAVTGGDLLGTRDVRKDENRNNECTCTEKLSTSVDSGDISENGRDIEISNLTVNKATSDTEPTYTCVSFDVEIY